MLRATIRGPCRAPPSRPPSRAGPVGNRRAPPRGDPRPASRAPRRSAAGTITRAVVAALAAVTLRAVAAVRSWLRAALTRLPASPLVQPAAVASTGPRGSRMTPSTGRPVAAPYAGTQGAMRRNGYVCSPAAGVPRNGLPRPVTDRYAIATCRTRGSGAERSARSGRAAEPEVFVRTVVPPNSRSCQGPGGAGESPLSGVEPFACARARVRMSCVMSINLRACVCCTLKLRRNHP